MAHFPTKNTNLRKFWRVMEHVGKFYGHLVYFTAILYTYFTVIWYIFHRFGMLYKGESGNPGSEFVLCVSDRDSSGSLAELAEAGNEK
jgi:hypothetical protein